MTASHLGLLLPSPPTPDPLCARAAASPQSAGPTERPPTAGLASIMPADAFSVRFRQAAGDIGPFDFGLSNTVQDLKAKLLAEWPTEGPLLKERPNSAAEIRLILSGKFLSDSDTLRSLQSSLGNPRDDLLVTMHVIVRPASMVKAQDQAAEKEKGKLCGCVVS